MKFLMKFFCQIWLQTYLSIFIEIDFSHFLWRLFQGFGHVFHDSLNYKHCLAGSLKIQQNWKSVCL